MPETETASAQGPALADPASGSHGGRANCENCDQPLTGPFCAMCGQSRENHRKSLWRWIGWAAGEVLSLEARAPRSFLLLVGRPGFLTREWLDGRRVGYTSPVRIYLTASLIFFGVVFILGVPGLEVPGWRSGVTDAADYERARLAFLRESRRLAALLVVVLVPILALLLKIVFLGRGRLLVDHLVFSVHFFAVVFLSWALAWPLLFLPGLDGWMAGGLVVAQFVFFFVALHTAYRGRWWATGVSVIALGGLFVGGIWVAERFDLVRHVGSNMAYQLGATYAQWERAASEAASREYQHWRTTRDTVSVDLGRELATRALELYETLPTSSVGEHTRIHMAELLLALERPAEALASAGAILDESPDHLLALGLAGSAAAIGGDAVVAREHFRRLLELYDAEYPRQLEGYEGHEEDFAALRAAAEQFLWD